MSPLPLAPLDVSATADATGAVSIRRRILAGHWWGGYCSVQGQGSPSWLLGTVGRSQMAQQGQFGVLGPLFLSPGQEAFLQGSGLTPGTEVDANFWGFQSGLADGSDLPGLLPSVMSAGSLAAAVTVGGTVGIAGNVPVVNPSGGVLSTVVIPTGPTTRMYSVAGSNTALTTWTSFNLNYGPGSFNSGTSGAPNLLYEAEVSAAIDSGAGWTVAYFRIAQVGQTGGTQTPTVAIGAISLGIGSSTTQANGVVTLPFIQPLNLFTIFGASVNLEVQGIMISAGGLTTANCVQSCELETSA